MNKYLIKIKDRKRHSFDINESKISEISKKKPKLIENIQINIYLLGLLMMKVKCLNLFVLYAMKSSAMSL